MKRVLVLCTGNSCRSQMAEGLFRELGTGAWESYSAGSKPAGFVHPLAIEAMKDCGIDISTATSKSINDFSGQVFDLVVTVCNNANEDCPFFPQAKTRLHWPFDDPADATGSTEQQLEVFIRVRNEIEAVIIQYLDK